MMKYSTSSPPYPKLLDNEQRVQMIRQDSGIPHGPRRRICRTVEFGRIQDPSPDQAVKTPLFSSQRGTKWLDMFLLKAINPQRMPP